MGTHTPATGAASMSVTLTEGRIVVEHGSTGETLLATPARKGDWDRIWDTLRSIRNGNAFDRVSDDGRWGLAGHTLYFIAGLAPDEDPKSCPMGEVWDPEHGFETACDAADEEVVSLAAEFEAFG